LGFALLDLAYMAYGCQLATVHVESRYIASARIQRFGSIQTCKQKKDM